MCLGRVEGVALAFFLVIGGTAVAESLDTPADPAPKSSGDAATNPDPMLGITVKDMGDAEPARDLRESEEVKEEAERLEETSGPANGRFEKIAGEELKVGNVLRMIEEQSPQIRGATMREVQYNDLLYIQRSAYVPYIEGGLGVQWPSTASNGIPEYGLAQPNFSHPGAPDAGLWTLYKAFDLTREFGTLAAKHQAESTRFRTRVIRYQVYQTALQLYFDTARYRSYMNTYERLQLEIDGMIALVRKLVKGGQHTVLALMLLEDQATESAIRYAVYREDYHNTLRRLAIQLGKEEREIAVPASTDIEEADLSVIRPGDKSPLIDQAEADHRAAESNVSKAAAQHAPTVWFAGAVGAVSAGVPTNYNAAFALTIPVFEGFRINADTDRAQAAEMEAKHAIETAKLTVSDQNERYDRAIQAARISLRILIAEKKAAYDALKIAKARYLSFLGGLADLREGIRNLMRIETSINDARADLLNALAAKAILNGGTVAHF
jgi:outer membrane protein TolC